MVCLCSEKTIFTPLCLAEMPSVLPLKQAQCSSEWHYLFLIRLSAWMWLMMWKWCVFVLWKKSTAHGVNNPKCCTTNTLKLLHMKMFVFPRLYWPVFVIFRWLCTEGGWRDRTPQKVLYVEDLTDIMMENFPDFWKLGQAYFSGEFNRTREVPRFVQTMRPQFWSSLFFRWRVSPEIFPLSFLVFSFCSFYQLDDRQQESHWWVMWLECVDACVTEREKILGSGCEYSFLLGRCQKRGSSPTPANTANWRWASVAFLRHC